MKSYDCLIIGASFAGLSAAVAAASRGLSVAVFERKKRLTTGLHTTGILVQEAKDYLDPPAELLHPIHKVQLLNSRFKGLTVEGEDYRFYATDTPRLLDYLAQRAEKLGVTIQFDAGFDSAREEHGEYVLDNVNARGKFLIGCDGVRSDVAVHFNLSRNEKCLLGAELELEGHIVTDPDMLHCILDPRFARGYIGWVMPGVNITQIGIATSDMNEKIDSSKFLEHVKPLLTTSSPKIVGRRGGLIPAGGRLKTFARGNVILCGDAAGIVSPLTAGGIHTALFYGTKLGEALADHLQMGAEHPSTAMGRIYPKFIFKRLLRGLYEYLPGWASDLAVTSATILPAAKSVFFRQNIRV